MSFTLGMTSVTFREKTVEEIVALAARAGLSEIEWGADRHILPGDFAAVEKARAEMEKYGISCSSYGSYYRLSDNDPEGFRLICETAKALGAKVIRTWLGRRGSAVMPAQVRAAIMEEARTLADIAAQYSLTLAFEFHGKTLNDTGESSLHFLLDCAKENIKTYWQPLSFSDNEKNLSMVLPHLCAVHVFTWDDDYNRYPLADGETQWKRYLSILKEAKIPTKLIMEFVKDDNEEQFLEDAAFLRSLIAD